MKYTAICIAVAAALASSSAFSAEEENTEILTESIKSGEHDGSGTKSILFQDVNSENGYIFIQSNDTDDLVIKNYKNISVVTGGGDGQVYVANWWTPKSIIFENIESINIGTVDAQVTGSAFQALDASIELRDIGSLYINTTGNALYLQSGANAKDGGSTSLNVTANDDVIIKSDISGIYLESYSSTPARDASLIVQANSIT